MQELSYSPGLEGVIAGVSSLSQIDTENNVLTYRGYNVQDLVDHASFEEVAFLILNGELPNGKELADFDRRLRSEREVPQQVYDVLKLVTWEYEPLDWLEVGVVAVELHST